MNKRFVWCQRLAVIMLVLALLRKVLLKTTNPILINYMSYVLLGLLIILSATQIILGIMCLVEAIHED